MYSKLKALSLFFTIVIIACNVGNEENHSEKNIIITDTIKEIKNNMVTINSDSFKTKLEGEWKEPEYPFRQAHFKNASVKFIEEGLAEDPTFKEYRILKDCPFGVNNVKNATPDDVFLVVIESKTCEIIKITNDTLILSGFSTNTNNNYSIIYKRQNN